MPDSATTRAVRALRSLAGIVGGYVIMVLGTTVVQNNLLGGHIGYSHSPPKVLLVAAILTPLAAVLGGVATGAIAGRAALWHVTPMCLAIALETAHATFTHSGGDPLWFRAAAALALILGAVVGAWGWEFLVKRNAKAAAAST